MSTSTVRYPIKQTNKIRFITTYKNNRLGMDLRVKHKYFINYLEDFHKKDIYNEYSYAYLKGKSTKMVAKKHLNNKYFLYLDIKSFFESINVEILKGKCDFLISNNLKEKDLYDVIDSCRIPNTNKGIAIGLIPSAILSNIYMNGFDQIIADYLNTLNNNITYTRYSDDILISSNTKFDKDKIINIIKVELKKLKLILHKDKVMYKELIKPTDHIKVLGLNIIKGKDNNYITVSRKYKKKMKHTKNKISKNGMKNYILYNEKK